MTIQDSDRFPSRKSPRMSHYNYATPNYYFITICTHEKHCVFGNCEKLSHWGQIAEQGILAIPDHFPNVTVDKYVVMPNHIHAILCLGDNCPTISNIIGQYKSYVTRKIHISSPEVRIWQTSFHDHVIRDQKRYEKIWEYIENNPLKWQEDCFYLEQISANQSI